MEAIPYASIVVASTMEIEFVACFKATIQANWLRNFISGLEIVDNIVRPLKMYCDNSAVVFFLRTTNIVRVSIEHISTNFMIAYPLNKGLSPKTFIEHVESMGIIVIDNCRNVPFAGERGRGSRVRFPKEEMCAESPPTFICGKRRENRRKLVKMKILSSGVVFTLEEGISTSHVCLKGQQPIF